MTILFFSYGTGVRNRVPTLLVTKISGLSRTPKAFFQDLVIRQTAVTMGFGAEPQPPVMFSYIQIKSELIFANFGICTCIIVSASHIVA